MIFVFKLSSLKCQGNCIDHRGIGLCVISFLNSENLFSITVRFFYFFFYWQKQWFIPFSLLYSRQVHNLLQDSNHYKVSPTKLTNGKFSKAKWIGKLWKDSRNVCSFILQVYSVGHYVINWICGFWAAKRLRSGTL
jgi:hypothetical protein